MRREFLLNILFLVFINLLIKPFFIFGIDRTIQNRVGLEEYGLYAALFNFTFVISIINDFGIPNFNNQRISKDPSLLPSYFPNLLIAKLVLGLIYTLVVGVVAWLIGYNFSQYHLIGFLLFNQILLSFIHYFRSNIAGLGRYRMDSLMTVLERLLLIGICSVLLWSNPFEVAFQIEWFIYAQTISLFIAVLVAFGIVYQHLHPVNWQFDKSLLLNLLKQSAPFALILFLMTVYTRIDFVMIERLAVQGKREAGIYAAAYRLLDAVNVIGLLFSGLLLPMFSKLLTNRTELRSLLQMSSRILFCGTILTAIWVFFFRVEIMELLYVHTQLYAAEILGILIVTFIFVGGGYIYGALLIANNSVSRLNTIFIISVFLNIGLNYFVIPIYGALGAAYTTLLTQGFAFIGQVHIARKVVGLQIDWQLLKALCYFTVLMGGITYAGYTYFPFGWIWNSVLVLGIGGMLGFATGLLQFKWLVEIGRLK